MDSLKTINLSNIVVTGKVRDNTSYIVLLLVRKLYKA